MTNEELLILGIEPKNHDETYKRLSWDEYFIQLCYKLSDRSHDAQTHHACLFVKDNHIVSAGFNGFPENAPDNILPNLRPAKYDFVNHAEMSACISSAKRGVSVKGCKAYITGRPCHSCAKLLVSLGIYEWIIGNRTHQETEKEILLYKFWVEHFNVKITKIN